MHQIISTNQAKRILVSKPSKSLIIAGLMLLTSLLYLNTFFNGFVYDDHFVITQNAWIKDFRYIPRIIFSSEWSFMPGNPSVNYYRPTFHILNMAVYYAFGEKPWGYHLASVFLHSLNTALVFLIASRILGSANGVFYGLAAGALFATHPVHVESVAWTSAVADLIYSFFFLSSFYAYISRPHGITLYFLLPVLFLLALVSKETAVALPIFIFLYEYLVKGKPIRPLLPWLNRLLPFFLVLMIYLAMRVYSLGGLAPETVKYTNLTAFQSIINIFLLIPLYLWKLLFPFNLNIFHSIEPLKTVFNIKGLPSVLFVCALMVVILWTLRKNPFALFLLFWIGIPLLPALYIPGLGREVFAERYLYLPSVGFVLLAAYWLNYLKKRVNSRTGWTAWVFLVFVLAAYSSIAFARTFAWRDDLSIWLDASRKSPKSGFVHGSLGNAYKERGLVEEAIREYEKALSLELLPDDRWGTNYKLAGTYMEKGDYGIALSAYKRALEIKPSSIKAMNGLGLAHEKMGRIDESIRWYEKAVEGSPLDWTIHNNLGRVYRKKGNFREAEAHYREATGLNPKDPELRNNLGALYALQGRYSEAAEEFTEALKLDPNYGAAKENLQKALRMIEDRRLP